MMVHEGRILLDLRTIPFVVYDKVEMCNVFYRGHNITRAEEIQFFRGGIIRTMRGGTVIKKKGLADLLLTNTWVVVHDYGSELYETMYFGPDKEDALRTYYKDRDHKKIFKDGKEIKNELL